MPKAATSVSVLVACRRFDGRGSLLKLVRWSEPERFMMMWWPSVKLARTYHSKDPNYVVRQQTLVARAVLPIS